MTELACPPCVASPYLAEIIPIRWGAWSPQAALADAQQRFMHNAQAVVVAWSDAAGEVYWSAAGTRQECLWLAKRIEDVAVNGYYDPCQRPDLEDGAT